MAVEIIIGDSRDELRKLPDESVHCIVTSPPYFGLRDYGNAGQMGLEATPAEFVDALVGVLCETRRVLRNDGTLWLNLGDSYANDGKWGGSTGGKYAAGLHGATGIGRRKLSTGLKTKDLIGIPWRVAFALQADGWYLRQDIIWSKPNPMPESVTDRCTKAHEYLFLLSKSPRYYFDADAIAEPVSESSIARWAQDIEAQEGSTRVPGKTNVTMKAVGNGETRNRRSVWTVTTKPFKGSHFATFPPDLIEPCILAGCPAQCCAECGAAWERESEVAGRIRVREGSDTSGDASAVAAKGKHGKSSIFTTGSKPVLRTTGWKPTCSCSADTVPGTVLDPFGGAGTTGLVADRLQRNAILIELQPGLCRYRPQAHPCRCSTARSHRMILTASRPEAPPRKRFISRIREIVDDYHRGLKPAGAWAEVLAALREMDRRIETKEKSH